MAAREAFGGGCQPVHANYAHVLLQSERRGYASNESAPASRSCPAGLISRDQCSSRLGDLVHHVLLVYQVTRGLDQVEQ